VIVMDTAVNTELTDTYPVERLCRSHSFEEVAYLAWHGQLPTHDQIFSQNRAERAQRALEPHVAAALAARSSTAHPLDILRSALGMLGANDPTEHDITPEAIQAKALRLFAVLPTIIALDQRRRDGLGAVAPRDDLSFAANFLYMTFGKVPEPQVVAAFETSLILRAGQSFSAPIFTSPASTDLYRGLAAAIGALKEPPHASAGPTVVEMMNEIAIPDNARPWLEEALGEGRTITGFCRIAGPNGDVRVPAMRKALQMIASLRRGQQFLDVYEALATATQETTGLRPNLDYPSDLAYHLIGFDTQMFAPICVAACLPGWTAHFAGNLAGHSSTQHA
jgi:citrate synthase